MLRYEPTFCIVMVTLAVIAPAPTATIWLQTTLFHAAMVARTTPTTCSACVIPATRAKLGWWT